MTSWYAFDKYYLKTDDVAAYGTALLLAPHRRKIYLDRNWKPVWRRAALAAATKLWVNTYKDKHTRDEEGALGGGEGVDRGRTEEPDEFDIFEQQQAALNAVKDEFDHYINSPPIQLTKGSSSLDWWLQEANRAPYPSLSRMAIDILSIPPMSAEPERIFSGARRTITWSRHKLGVRNIERMECLKSWIRTGIAADWREDLSGEAPEDREDLGA